MDTRVMVGACRCPRTNLEGEPIPGLPHAEDWVELYEQVPIRVGSAVLYAIRVAGNDEGRLTALMSDAYVRYGIRSWSFTDEQGRPISVDPTGQEWTDDVARLLPWDQGGAEVADRADDLYGNKVLRPLVERSSTPSAPGPMAVQTSASPSTGPRHRKRSKQSSRTTTVAGQPSEAPAP